MQTILQETTKKNSFISYIKLRQVGTNTSFTNTLSLVNQDHNHINTGYSKSTRLMNPFPQPVLLLVLSLHQLSVVQLSTILWTKLHYFAVIKLQTVYFPKLLLGQIRSMIQFATQLHKLSHYKKGEKEADDYRGY